MFVIDEGCRKAQSKLHMLVFLYAANDQVTLVSVSRMLINKKIGLPCHISCGHVRRSQFS